MGAYNLHIIKTNKFKTITVEVNFRRLIEKDEITKRNLLKAVLLNSTYDFPTEKELIIETEKLYDLKLLSSNSRIGNYTNLAFKVRFLNETYTKPGMNKESIQFLMNVLFHPNIKKDAFKEEIVNNCKKQLEKSILSLKDNKLKYSLIKLLENTQDYPYSYNSFGYLEDLEKIGHKNLYEYYKSVLNNDFIDIFVVGDIETAEVKDLLKDYLNIRTFKKEQKNITVKELSSPAKIIRNKETDSVNQSQLTILYSINNLTDYERKYVLNVYNEMLGGSSNSLLFETVREQNSYAYYINSISKNYDNILMIYSGIEKGNEETVLKLINQTLTNINKGKFKENIIDNSKETIISSIKASLDSPSGIINTNYAKILVGSDDYQTRIEKISQVTKQDIIDVSKKIKIHSVFILEGEDKNETD